MSESPYSRVLDALRARGTPLGALAEARGWHPQTAYSTVRRYAGRPVRPQGVEATEILSTLRELVGAELLPHPPRRRRVRRALRQAAAAGRVRR